MITKLIQSVCSGDFGRVCALFLFAFKGSLFLNCAVDYKFEFVCVAIFSYCMNKYKFKLGAISVKFLFDLIASMFFV